MFPVCISVFSKRKTRYEFKSIFKTVVYKYIYKKNLSLKNLMLPMTTECPKKIETHLIFFYLLEFRRQRKLQKYSK